MISDLGSYSVSDFLLFSKDVLFQIFETYNRDIWPLQVVWLAIAAFILFSAFRPVRYPKIVGLLVACAWVFSGSVFHLKYFLPINWSAKYFSMIFIAEAFLILVFTVIRPKVCFALRSSPQKYFGVGLFFISAFVPIEMLLGQSFYQVRMFGWGVDMTALGTIGLLLTVRVNLAALGLGVLPVLWCVISALMYYGLR